MKKAFGLIEVVVAVSIIAIFLGALLALVSMGTKMAVVSKHYIQAANLAREGMEMVREIRDTAVQNDVNWTDGTDIDHPTCWGLGVGGSKQLDYTSGIGLCNYSHWRLTSGSENITIEPTGDNVQYTREIYIDNVGPAPSPPAKRIRVVVTWQEGSSEKNVTMRSYITRAVRKVE